MKKVLITGGPTIEPIDEVMKITNFATGSLSVTLAELFLDGGDEVVLVVNGIVDTKRIAGNKNLKIVEVETTEDMLNAIEKEGKSGDFAALMHTAAVGDYKSDFTFLMEDVAEEIYGQLDSIKSADDILKILADPKCKLNDDSKISSYQNNLTVKLGLTPKIIASLRGWFPDAKLIGCKLLESVSKDELFEVAKALCKKNKMDYIMANDLADLRAGEKARYMVNVDGFTGATLDEAGDIYKFVKGIY